MTAPSRPKDESPEGAMLALAYASATLRAFAGKTPFIDPSTGRTLQPEMPVGIYAEIAKVHAELGELLRDAPASEDGARPLRRVAVQVRKTLLPITGTPVRCAICKGEAAPELMKKFTSGFVHFLCDRREHALAENGPHQQ